MQEIIEFKNVTKIYKLFHKPNKFGVFFVFLHFETEMKIE